MPKFFYTTIVVTLLVWAAVLFFGSGTLPNTAWHIIAFVFGVFIAFGLTFTTFSFLYFNYRASHYMNRHMLYRKSAKYGFFASFCLCGFLLLRVFDLAGAVNLVLYTVLCVFLYNQFKSKRV